MKMNKKVVGCFLAVFMLLVSVVSVGYAFTDILTEGFESGVMPPSGWTVDNGNPGQPWEIITAEEDPECVHSGNYAAWIYFDANNVSDNWLISPELDLSDYSSVALVFWAMSDTNWAGATMKLYINDDVIWDMIEDEDWEDFIYREMTFDLSSYIGEIIDISWCYVGFDGESFGLDDIVVSGTGAQNNPPNEPSNPNPLDGATNVSVDADLNWTGGDPDGDPVTYDVYFGNSSPPSKVVSNQSNTTYDPGTMTFNTTYYWQIVAWDDQGESTASPIWSFTTELIHQNSPPYIPSNPDPPHHATGVGVMGIVLNWTGGDPDPGDTLRYRLYIVRDNKGLTYWIPKPYYLGNQSFNLTVHWQIRVVDNHGAWTKGPWWWFTTRGNNTPNTPIDPIPQDGATEIDINSDLSWNCSDPDGDPLTYDIYFGANSTPPLVASGQSNTNYDPGQLEWNVTCYWRIVAFDNYSNTNQSPIWHFTTRGNNSPGAPVITGTVNGTVGIEYEYVFVSTDQDNDSVYYYIDWGDGTFDDWFGHYASGSPQTVSHTWSEQRNYTIRAKAKDVYGAESDWGTLKVTMPKNQQRSNQNIYQQSIRNFIYYIT